MLTRCVGSLMKCLATPTLLPLFPKQGYHFVYVPDMFGPCFFNLYENNTREIGTVTQRNCGQYYGECGGEREFCGNKKMDRDASFRELFVATWPDALEMWGH